MSLRTIRIMVDEVLTKTCREVTKVTPRISNLIDDMLETMYDACGVGLAAPQVTYVMHDLKEKGFDVSADATTVEEAADEIYNFLKKRQEVQS